MRTALVVGASALLVAAGLAAAGPGQAPPPESRSPRSATWPASRGSCSGTTAAPEKKFIMESMSGGVALLDYDGDGLLDVYLIDSLTVDTAERPEGGAQRALPQPRRLPLRGRHRQGRRRPPRLGDGRVHGRRGRRRCRRHLRDRSRAQLPLPQQSRRHVHRRRRAGRVSRPAAGRPAAASPTTTATAVSTCSSAATCTWTSTTCRSSARAPEGRGARRHLPVPRRRRAVRATRAARRVGPAVPQRGQRPLRRGRGEGRRARRPRVLRAGHRVVRLRRRRLAGPVRGQRLPAELPLPEPEGRHLQGDRLPRRRRGERGRLRAGQHGRGRRRLHERRPPEPVRHELRRGVQRPLPQRRDALHGRVVPLEDRPGQHAARDAGARPSSTTTTTAGRT